MFLLTLFALLLVVESTFKHYQHHSFYGPFNNINTLGMRTLEGWRFGGDAQLFSNYLRLTPDVDDKKGHVWNLKPILTDHFTSTVRFRISGSAKSFFGDGIGIWFSDQKRYKEGPIHGFTNTFLGFGVLLDTFRNQGSPHKDIRVIFSDGQTPVDMENPNAIGCDASYRLWEKRDDFSVTSHSAIRIQLKNNKLSIFLDLQAKDEWKPCIEDYQLPFSDGWALKDTRGVFMGLTAITGDLHDNHDILGVITSDHDGFAPWPMSDEKITNIDTDVTTGNSDIDKALEKTVSIAKAHTLEQVDLIKQTLEYSMSTMEESIKQTIQKLINLDEENRKRIEELERKVEQMVGEAVGKHVDSSMDIKLENSLTKRIQKLEEQLRRSVDSNIDTKLERKLESKIEKKLPDFEEKFQSTSRPYIVILMVLIVFVVGMLLYSFTFQNKLKKKRGYLD